MNCKATRCIVECQHMELGKKGNGMNSLAKLFQPSSIGTVQLRNGVTVVAVGMLPAKKEECCVPGACVAVATQRWCVRTPGQKLPV